jgi:hypothetical protein
MSTIKVNKIENTSTTNGGVSIDVDGHVTIDGQQMPTAGPLSNRNLIINGAMRVAQRGTTSPSGGYQTVDRMDTQLTLGTVAQSQETLATSDLPFTQDGLTHFLRVTNTTGSTAAGAFRSPSTQLEAQDVHYSGWNYKSASSYVTLSFWVRASVSQEFYASLVSFDGTAQNYVFSFTPAANTWTKITKTIPGNANLQFDADTGAGLKVSIAAFWGTNWTAPSVTTDSWQTFTSSTRFPDFATTWASTNGATFDVTGIQLEVGSKSTPFEHRSYGDELARCQRYYYEVCDPNYNSEGIGSGEMWETNAAYISVSFPTTMRALPSFSGFGAGTGPGYIIVYASNSVGYSNDSNSILALQRAGVNGAMIYTSNFVDTSSGVGGSIQTFTQGYAVWMEKRNSSLRINFNAEL